MMPEDKHSPCRSKAPEQPNGVAWGPALLKAGLRYDGVMSGDNRQHTVLVVEDDATNAILVEAILRERGGFHVVHTTDPARVLDLVDSGELSAVLMDIGLSGSTLAGHRVDGVELTQLIRERPNGRTLPVILFTAHAMLGDRERYLFSSGANDYVTKPIVDQDALVRLITRHIQAAGGDADSR